MVDPELTFVDTHGVTHWVDIHLGHAMCAKAVCQPYGWWSLLKEEPVEGVATCVACLAEGR